MKQKAESPLPTLDAAQYFLERNSKAFDDFMHATFKMRTVQLDAYREGESLFLKETAKPDKAGAEAAKKKGKTEEEELDTIDTMELRDSLMGNGSYTVLINTFLPKYGEKIKISSSVTIKEAPGGGCIQINEQDFQCNVWGLGMIAERMAKSGFETGMKKLPELMGEWAKIRAELAATPDGRMRLLQDQPDLRHLPWVQQYVSEMVPEQGIPGSLVLAAEKLRIAVHVVAVASSQRKLQPAATAYFDASEELDLTDEQLQAKWEGEGDKWMKEHVRADGKQLPKALMSKSMTFREPLPEPPTEPSRAHQPAAQETQSNSSGCLGGLFSCCRPAASP